MGKKKQKKHIVTIWRNKHNPNITAEKKYEDVNRVMIYDNTKGTKAIDDITYDHFNYRIYDWELIQGKV